MNGNTTHQRLGNDHFGQRKRLPAALLALALALALTLLVACGGGGGGGESGVVSAQANAPPGQLAPPANTPANHPVGGASGSNKPTTELPPPQNDPESEEPPPPPPPPDPPAGPEVIGRWSGLFDWPQVGVHLQLLPNGNVLSWAYDIDDHDPTSTSKQVFEIHIPPDGPPGAYVVVPNLTTDIACSGFTLLADGRMFAAGGESRFGGTPAVNIFDHHTGSWSRISDMNNARWYPTATTLANGDVLVTGGLIDFATSAINGLPQVWSTTEGWRNLTTAIANEVGIYPRMHLAPNGRVFKSGMQARTRYLDTRGTGSWTEVGLLNHRAGRDYGTSVMYGHGKVLAVGGGDPPTASAEVIDLNDSSPAWRWTTPMKHTRRHLNATLLADGKVLVVGGTASPGFNDATQAVREAEMWNPSDESWTTMASMSAKRVYHSTALLLPDGRVLAAGGGDPAPVNGVDNRNAEIFSPPYLFAGPRPTITGAPSVIAYGAGFTLQTPDAGDIVKATWIRLGSVTHAFDNSQRVSVLPVTTLANGVELVAPSDPNLVPPGHYMLFLINRRGVPSVARIIQIL